MNRGIVICSHVNSDDQLRNCIKSISQLNIPLFCVINSYGKRIRIGNVILLDEDKYELGAIYESITEFNLDEFVLLQDSIEIKDVRLFDMCFDLHEGKSVYFFNDFYCYAGKYRKETLNKLLPLPIVNSKIESVRQENDFHKLYLNQEPESVNLFSLRDTDKFEEKFGRKNMIIENDYLKKYKGTWNWSMIT